MTGGNVVAARVSPVRTADTFDEAAITSVLVKRLQVDSALCASGQHRLTPLFRRQRQVIAVESDSDSSDSSDDRGVVVSDPLVIFCHLA